MSKSYPTSNIRPPVAPHRDRAALLGRMLETPKQYRTFASVRSALRTASRYLVRESSPAPTRPAENHCQQFASQPRTVADKTTAELHLESVNSQVPLRNLEILSLVGMRSLTATLDQEPRVGSVSSS